MRTRIICYIICALLGMSSADAQTEPVMKVSPARKKQLQERAVEFIHSYYELLSSLSAEYKSGGRNLIYEYGSELMMESVSTFTPEFSVDGTEYAMGNREQYSQAFDAFLVKQNGAEILMQPEDIKCSKELYKPDDESCYSILTYTLKIQADNKEVGKKECEAYITFPDAYAKVNIDCVLSQLRLLDKATKGNDVDFQTANQEAPKAIQYTVVENKPQTTQSETRAAESATKAKVVTTHTNQAQMDKEAAEYVRKGLAALKKFQDKNALAYFNQALSRGSKVANLYVGDIYYNGGNDIERNYPYARAYYSKAANAGLADGQYMFGLMLRNGQGGPKDIPAARLWLYRASQQGHKEAERLLNKL